MGMVLSSQSWKVYSNPSSSSLERLKIAVSSLGINLILESKKTFYAAFNCRERDAHNFSKCLKLAKWHSSHYTEILEHEKEI